MRFIIVITVALITVAGSSFSNENIKEDLLERARKFNASIRSHELTFGLDGVRANADPRRTKMEREYKSRGSPDSSSSRDAY